MQACCCLLPAFPCLFDPAPAWLNMQFGTSEGLVFVLLQVVRPLKWCSLRHSKARTPSQCSSTPAWPGHEAVPLRLPVLLKARQSHSMQHCGPPSADQHCTCCLHWWCLCPSCFPEAAGSRTAEEADPTRKSAPHRPRASLVSLHILVCASSTVSHGLAVCMQTSTSCRRQCAYGSAHLHVARMSPGLS